MWRNRSCEIFCGIISEVRQNFWLSPDEGTAVLTIVQVGLIPVHVAEIVLAAHEEDRGVGAEPSVKNQNKSVP